MKFVNRIDKPLSFDLGGDHYEVPVGGHCHVPERYAYAVKLHGLPLDPVEEPPAAPTKPQPQPQAKPKATKAAKSEASDDDLLEELTRPDATK